MTDRRNIVVGARWPGVWLLLMAGAAPAQPTVAESQGVTVVGGQSEENPYLWQWTVTNRRESPIVYMSFPHVHADIFEYPKDDWQDESTNRNRVGVLPQPGVFAIRALEADRGVQPGQSVEVSIRVTRQGAWSEPRAALFELADGTRIRVPGVYCPQDEPWFQHFAPLIGGGTLFALFLLYQYVRGRRKAGPRTSVRAD